MLLNIKNYEYKYYANIGNKIHNILTTFVVTVLNVNRQCNIVLISNDIVVANVMFDLDISLQEYVHFKNTNGKSILREKYRSNRKINALKSIFELLLPLNIIYYCPHYTRSSNQLMGLVGYLSTARIPLENDLSQHGLTVFRSPIKKFPKLSI
uniref:RNase H domain-containing protein n=1 Tax=Heterorhabditis bacteriophora TaxID=37862 RepID=A0A1I7WY68_HETBA